MTAIADSATDNDSDSEPTASRINRRSFIAGVGVGAAVGAPAALAGSSRSSKAADPAAPSLSARARDALELRIDAATLQHAATPSERPLDNGDEALFADDFRASFHKTLPHNDYGEVDAAAYRQLRSALIRADFDALAAVPLDASSDRGLANPLAAYAFDLQGADSWALRMPIPPAFGSRRQAAEMVEVYWQAVTRDVPFRDYDSDSDIFSASVELARTEGFVDVSPGTLFL